MTQTMIASKTILIAEDNPDMQSIYLMILSDSVHTIHLVKDGQAAMDHLAEQTPDLLILDVSMPYFTGLEILRQIRNEERFAKSKTIIATSNSAASRSEAAELADFCLIKPMDLFRLQTLIDRLLTM